MSAKTTAAQAIKDAKNKLKVSGKSTTTEAAESNKKFSIKNSGGLATRTDMYRMRPQDILTDAEFNFNPRNEFSETDEAWATFKESILTMGIQVPLEVYVRGEKIYLSHGFRRHKAIMELVAEGKEDQIGTVPVFQISANDETILLRHFILNDGKPLTPIEKAHGLKRLRDMYKMTMADIARKTSMPYSQVVYLMDLLDNASSEVIKAVEKGELAIATAKELMKAATTAAEQNTLLEEGRAAAQDEAKEKAETQAAKPTRKPRKAKEVVAVVPADVDPETGEVLLPEPVASNDSDSDDNDDDEIIVPTPKIKLKHIETLATSNISLETKIQMVVDRAKNLGDGVDQALVERVENIFHTIFHKNLTEISEKSVLAMFDYMNENA